MKVAETIEIQELSDEDIIHEYRQSSDNRLFNELYRRHSHKVYGKCLSILKDEVKADDATQEVFIKILLNLSNFRSQSKFTTWIYSITYNYCIDWIRRHKKQQVLFSQDEILDFKNVPDDVDDQEILETNISRLKTILNDLPVGDKAILMMKYQDSMRIKDMAEVLLITESAVKMRIKRAKQRFILIYKEKYAEG